MKSKIDARKLLSFWEDSWGKLTPEWSENFLNDPRLEVILAHPGLRILSVVQKHKKLDQIILQLQSQENHFRPETQLGKKLATNSPTRKPQTLGTSQEVSQIYDWMTRFKASQFDPENTFPRLIVESTREICDSKRKYKTEKDALLALLNLEEIKGELIKQLPYRCNICKEFHNTHLISRETFEKLRKKYKPN